MSTLIRNAVVPEALAGNGLPAGPVDILLDGGTITAITAHASEPTPDSPQQDTPAAGEVVDAGGRFVLPGLIDAHLHLLGVHDLEVLTDHGVTTAAELGTHPDSLVDELRHAEGLTAIVSAGSAASAPGAHQTTQMGFPQESAVTGPDDAARFIAWRVAAGSDVIKIIIEDPHNPHAKALAPETLRALVDAAHARGLLTIAHAVTAYSFTLGLDAGVDVLTHSPLDRPLDDQTVARMVEQGTGCSPTLTMMQAVAAAFASNPGPKLSLDNALESVRRMHAAGVPIAAGTDANASPGAPARVAHGSSLHDELGLLVRSGLTPVEAITAATSGAAASLRLDDRGVLAPGARADLLLLDADPTVDVANSRGIAQAWIAGRRVR